MAYRVAGRLDVRALAASLESIVLRHEAFRSTYPALAGEPVHRVADRAPAGLQIEDLGALPGPDLENRARRLLVEVVRQPPDLERGPLYRFLLVRLHAELHYLGFFFHDIIFDGFSGGIFLRELAELYRGEIRGAPVRLPTLPCQLSDFAHWQREALKGKWGSEQLRYWQRKLDGLGPPSRLPLDYRRHPVPRYRQENLCLPVESELVSRLTSVVRWLGTTPFVVFQAAFTLLLRHAYGRRDVAMLSVYANRTRAPFAGVIGSFSNILVLRTSVPETGGFQELVERVDLTSREAFAHQALPFGVVWKEILEPLYRGESRPPFPVKFILQNAAPDWPGLPGLDMTPVSVRKPHDQDEIDAWIEVKEGADWTAEFKYDPDLFKRATIARLAQGYLALLRGVASDPSQSLSRLFESLEAHGIKAGGTR